MKQHRMPDCRLSKWLMLYLESGENKMEGGEGKRMTMTAKDKGHRGLLQRTTMMTKDDNGSSGGITMTTKDNDSSSGRQLQRMMKDNDNGG